MTDAELRELARRGLDLFAAKDPGGVRHVLNRANVSSRAALRLLEALGPVRLQHLVDHLAALDWASRAVLATELASTLRDIQTSPGDAPEGRHRLISNLVEFADVLGAIGVDLLFLDLRVVLYDALRLHEGVAAASEPADYSAAPRAERDDAAAFVLAVCLTSEVEGVGRGLAPDPKRAPRPELTALCRRHLDDPLRVAAVAHERGTVDPAVLAPLLDSDTPALADGHL